MKSQLAENKPVIISLIGSFTDEQKLLMGRYLTKNYKDFITGNIPVIFFGLTLNYLNTIEHENVTEIVINVSEMK